ncbi:MAG: histidinol-phosphate aminotransferase family protein [Gemmatimonadota bacterium]|nr:histidinol-phosphate aminotransferase family protein [Gemmatimonadota bacterium]
MSTHLREVVIYAPDETPCAIDLSDNTNLWGMPPAARIAIANAGPAVRYPSAYCGELKRALSSHLGVDAAMIVTGCGSDDVLDSAMRALGNPGDTIAYPEPTFTMIPTIARVNRLVPVGIALRSDYTIDVDALLAERAQITYLCSPNNPTSTAIARADLERVVNAAAGIVIIDEAYAEFAGANCIDLLGTSDRLFITRTMSKAFGLAGLRIGYGVSSAVLATEVEKSRGPYKVNALAECAAVAVLRNGMSWVRDTVAESISVRARLTREFGRRGFGVAPSAANFLFVPTADAREIARRLRTRGVAVRVFDALPTFGSALRITVGPWPAMDRLLAALDGDDA